MFRELTGFRKVIIMQIVLTKAKTFQRMVGKTLRKS